MDQLINLTVNKDEYEIVKVKILLYLHEKV